MGKLSYLASVAETRAVLEAHGLMTKKALGQHFLINDGIVQHICDLAELGPEDKVLEVGPGIGTLTVALLQRAGQVASIEMDTDLPAVLAETCAEWADRFTLIQGDAAPIRFLLLLLSLQQICPMRWPLPSCSISLNAMGRCRVKR